MKLERYNSYKDSNIDWLEEIPRHWEIYKLKNAVRKIGDIDHYMPDSVSIGKPYMMTGDMFDRASLIDFSNCKQVSEKDFCRLSRKIKPAIGDLIFARYATIGTVCYVDIEKDFLVSYSCVIIKPNHKKVLGKYLFYFFKSNFFLKEITSYVNSNTQGNVGIDSLYRTRVVILPYEEQLQIANFLETKTLNIDKEISLLEQKIQKYQELKQTLIKQTVLRGLDKTVDLQDSETSWIGNIPKSWQIKRGKDIFKYNKIINKNLSCTNVLSLTYAGVINKDYNTTAGLNPDSYETYQFVNKDNLIFKLIDLENTKTSRVGLVHEDGIMSSAYIRLQQTRDICSKYFYYLYFYYYKINLFNNLGGGVRATLNYTGLMNIPIIVPTLKEQIEIANYLDKKTTKIDEIVKTLGMKIETLKEFRKTLINDVVTGKVKVV